MTAYSCARYCLISILESGSTVGSNHLLQKPPAVHVIDLSRFQDLDAPRGAAYDEAVRVRPQIRTLQERLLREIRR